MMKPKLQDVIKHLRLFADVLEAGCDEIDTGSMRSDPEVDTIAVDDFSLLERSNGWWNTRIDLRYHIKDGEKGK